MPLEVFFDVTPPFVVAVNYRDFAAFGIFDDVRENFRLIVVVGKRPEEVVLSFAILVEVGQFVGTCSGRDGDQSVFGYEVENRFARGGSCGNQTPDAPVQKFPHKVFRARVVAIEYQFVVELGVDQRHVSSRRVYVRHGEVGRVAHLPESRNVENRKSYEKRLVVIAAAAGRESETQKNCGDEGKKRRFRRFARARYAGKARSPKLCFHRNTPPLSVNFHVRELRIVTSMNRKNT